MSDSISDRPIRPAILAGGAGSRLWPLSTAARPKHLLPLFGADSLFEQTLRRFGDRFAPPIVVANRAQEADLRAIVGPGSRIILEPLKRDSAAAIALAASLAEEDELLLVCPSDHHIGDIEAFHRAIALARPAAEAGKIVTFGIEPSHPATGFGYIAAGKGDGVRPVARFIEKPDEEKAAAMLRQGGHYWNAGIFLALAGTWREELRRHAPAILEAAREALERGDCESPVIRVDEQAFARSPAKSIDYAVMEHSDRVAVVPVSMGWSDVGSWDAVFDASPKGDGGNVVVGDALVIDSHANLIRSDGPKVVAIGVDDLVIIATADAVLVTSLSHTQRVREAAEWSENDANG
ncbi:sugar phosphate nucleotidyltransferase [Sphingomonas sp. RB56-2]|uniref:Sugar phosphate nucleotidyltransferase n=1 Tax=Sphingomonas brevis TaxID=2908206 RepID=A0ABT0S9A5_9SPHN|nr:sugar phosphate nucleotidyltransferase [Sphingomonas brevis]MCL6740963.1 sugar phosphate nucleotidyltransferase [Sphingomonas brevis]